VFLVSVCLTTSIVVCEESTTGSQKLSDSTSDGSSAGSSSLEKSVSKLYDMTHNFLDLVVKEDFLDPNSKGAISKYIKGNVYYSYKPVHF